jgi:hypothetical protein
LENFIYFGMPRKVSFNDVPFDVYHGLAPPARKISATCFSSRPFFGEKFLCSRDPERSRSLNPELLSFDAWLGANIARMPIG